MAHLVITRVEGRPGVISLYRCCSYGLAHLPINELIACYPGGGEDVEAICERLSEFKTPRDAEFRCSVEAAHYATLAARCNRLLAPHAFKLYQIVRGSACNSCMATIANILKGDHLIACNPQFLETFCNDDSMSERSSSSLHNTAE